MRKADLVNKLVTLAGGDIDLVQLAIRTAAKGSSAADLDSIVGFIIQQRKARASVTNQR
jgi:hypothetical protein